MSADTGESLIAHLLELRNRLLKAVLALVIAFVALLPFANDLYTAAMSATSATSSPCARSCRPAAR